MTFSTYTRIMTIPIIPTTSKALFASSALWHPPGQTWHDVMSKTCNHRYYKINDCYSFITSY